MVSISCETSSFVLQFFHFFIGVTKRAARPVRPPYARQIKWASKSCPPRQDGGLTGGGLTRLFLFIFFNRLIYFFFYLLIKLFTYFFKQFFIKVIFQQIYSKKC